MSKIGERIGSYSPVRWVRERIRDGSIAEQVIYLGTPQFTQESVKLWRSGSIQDFSGALVEKQAIRSMLEVRPDLEEIVVAMMANPSRVYANRFVNAEFARLSSYSRKVTERFRREVEEALAY